MSWVVPGQIMGRWLGLTVVKSSNLGRRHNWGCRGTFLHSSATSSVCERRRLLNIERRSRDTVNVVCQLAGVRGPCKNFSVARGSDL
jgi:hypothetical protein